MDRETFTQFARCLAEAVKASGLDTTFVLAVTWPDNGEVRFSMTSNAIDVPKFLGTVDAFTKKYASDNGGKLPVVDLTKIAKAN